ncbi:carboxypeptidase-like regulatory domain-containing protein [Paenisporosarcina indica]|uniref:carboxypeptidase-like regulatory domain-containing protein n=1 Tax=Paenisporosarcina indica TaxID=650093 RepID=UPI00094F6717|nr:carboxypeptidase-like regulatory domain-containing protein [Paenisporosarcina indica]
MSKLSSILLISLLAIFLAACTDESESNKEKEEAGIENKRNTDGEATLTLEHTEFFAENWRSSNEHHKTFKGKVLYDNKSVVGAVVQVSEKRKTVTDKNGEFSISVDANIVEKDTIHITSLDDATIDGKKIDKKMKDEILSLEQDLTVYYPIKVDKVENNKENDSLVDVYAKVVLKDGDVFPKFGVEKFRISGTLKDHNGEPLVGAIVNLRRDGVEGFTKSSPSDKNGVFEMFYIPEDDESHYLNVYIPEKGLTYTLPDNKAFYFPDDDGIHLDIILPEKGTTIVDEPPTLVAESNDGGALHKGVLVGVNTDVDYQITVPKSDGTFVVTLPKDAWEKKPDFYEINYNEYYESILTPGDVLTKDILRLPDADEPNNINITN